MTPFRSLLRPLRYPRAFHSKISRLYESIRNKIADNPNNAHYFRIFKWFIKAGFAAHYFYEHFYTVGSGFGPSMLPTISVMGDAFLIDNSYRRGRKIQVGDIVSFGSVVDPEERAFKRVIGLEGDCVMMGTPGTKDNLMISVPMGHCWLVGDNMEYSRDSRLVGPIPMALIKGKVIAQVWPWGERRWLGNPLQPVEQ